MNADEVTARAVLAKSAAYDSRLGPPDLARIAAWTEALAGLDRDAALDAVARHYRTNPHPIMPADVVNAVDSPQSRMPAYRQWSQVKAEIEAEQWCQDAERMRCRDAGVVAR